MIAVGVEGPSAAFWSGPRPGTMQHRAGTFSLITVGDEAVHNEAAK